MNLKLNSVSARLYRWFYATESMPQTLCPYFWKLVIAYTLFIPWAILTLPTRVLKAEVDNGGERLFLSIVSWIGAAAVVSLAVAVSAFWGLAGENTFLGNMQRVGILVAVVILAVGSILGVVHIIKIIRDRKLQKRREYVWTEDGEYIKNPNYKEATPNLVKEFVLAKYHKYCPKIEWKNSID